MKWRLPDKALATVLKVGVYVFFALACVMLFGLVLGSLLPLTVAAPLVTFLAGVIANALAMRIYEHRVLTDVGLGWNSASVRNLLLGTAGGAGAALFVVLAPVLEGAGRFVKIPNQSTDWGAIVVLLVLLLFGAMGEELLFRGYGFQILMGALGPFATILPIAMLFAIMHGNNPNATTLGIVNTGLWGALLGFSFWRSGDLWLPIGLHAGWNWVLPLAGTNLSGIKMSVMVGYTLECKWWSNYGPEDAWITTFVVAALLFWLIKSAPIKRQCPYLLRDQWDEE